MDRLKTLSNNMYALMGVPVDLESFPHAHADELVSALANVATFATRFLMVMPDARIKRVELGDPQAGGCHQLVVNITGHDVGDHDEPLKTFHVKVPVMLTDREVAR